MQFIICFETSIYSSMEYLFCYLAILLRPTDFHRISTGDVSAAEWLRHGTAASSTLRQFPLCAERQRSAARRLDSRDHARTTRPRENQETTFLFVDVKIEQTNKRLLCLSEIDLQLLCLSEVDLLLIWSFFLDFCASTMSWLAI